jgi:uridine kinase
MCFLEGRTTFAELAACLVKLKRRQKTLLVGIDGCGGSGKTNFAEALQGALESVSSGVMTVHMDDFYRLSPTQHSGIRDQFADGVIAWQEVKDQVLIPLSQNRPGRYRRFDWLTNTLAEWCEVPIGGIVIVEGIRSLQGSLAAFYDHRIWVDCPRPIRLARGVARDGEEARRRWENVWMPAEDRYVENYRPEDTADLTVDGSGGGHIDWKTEFIVQDSTQRRSE